VNRPNTLPVQAQSHYQRVRRKRSVESQSTPYLSQHGGCPSTQGGTLAWKKREESWYCGYVTLSKISLSIRFCSPPKQIYDTTILIIHDKFAIFTRLLISLHSLTSSSEMQQYSFYQDF
jgi:hypothetical protein